MEQRSCSLGEASPSASCFAVRCEEPRVLVLAPGPALPSADQHGESKQTFARVAPQVYPLPAPSTAKVSWEEMGDTRQEAVT